MLKCDKSELEKVNLKLCKYILGVGRYSTNLAVKGDLGRFPLLINMLSLSVKYWMRTSLLETNALVKLSYLDSICNYKEGSNDWSGKIHKLLNLCELSDLWENQGLFSGNFYHKSCKTQLEKMYTQYWLEQINKPNSNKLRTYAKFKTSFNLENYVTSHECKNRRNFSKMRISAHTLAIETGRYTRPVTAEIDRTCIICKNGLIENEFHLLFECPLYTNEREILESNLSDFSTVTLAPNENNFITIMNYNNGDTEFSKEICKYIDVCLTMRAEVIKKSNTGNYCIENNYSTIIEFLRLARIIV